MLDTKPLSGGSRSSSGSDKIVKNQSSSSNASSGKEKVDFITSKSSGYKVQTMPASRDGNAKKSDKGKKRGRLITAAIIFLIIVLLGLGSGVVWIYRDSLGVNLSGFGSPSVAGDTENNADEQNQLNDISSDIESNKNTLSGLGSDVEGLKDKDLELESKAGHADDIQKIEIFLKKTDTDDDGVSDYDEVTVFGTDPENVDTDGDGFSDSDEIAKGFNPNGEGSLEDNIALKNSSLEKNVASPGDYVGAFSLTDVEVSSNDIKLEIKEGNKVSGSFTFEYQGSAYRVELSGTSEEAENGEIRMNFDSSMISGVNKETFKTELLLTNDSSTEELKGTVEFIDSVQDFLNNQKGEISFKLVAAGVPKNESGASTDVTEESSGDDVSSGSSNSPISVPASLQ